MPSPNRVNCTVLTMIIQMKSKYNNFIQLYEFNNIIHQIFVISPVLTTLINPWKHKEKSISKMNRHVLSKLKHVEKYKIGMFQTNLLTDYWYLRLILIYYLGRSSNKDKSFKSSAATYKYIIFAHFVPNYKSVAFGIH